MMDNNDLKLIIESMHHAQEMTEKLIISQQISDSKIKSLTKRLERFLELNADHIDYGIASISVHPLKRSVTSTVIKLIDVEINSQFFETLDISIVSSKSHEIIGVFLKVDNEFSPFGIKGQNEHSMGFQVSLPDGKPEVKLIEKLSNLGTTDWNTAKSIFSLLEKLLVEHQAKFSDLETSTHALLDYVKTQAAKLAAWPETLRYDHIKTGKINHTENYHSIQVLIKNLSVAQKTYANFDFKLSTVIDDSNNFGSNPRLEFSETSKNVIENWYAESNDDAGGKLELRLAAPNALDTTVWGLLSDTDKLLITGLIGKLPTMIDHLAKAEPSLSLRWTDWCSLAVDTRTIFIKNMVTQHNRLTRSRLSQPA